MRKSLLVLLAGVIVMMSSCRKDFEFENSVGGLEFSKDTVYLDTVFTNIGSSTYSLKVYNRSDKDISIPEVRLGKGLDSKYRITVDGMAGNGKIFNNVELLAEDSLYIFIETTVNIAEANPTDFLYTDQILFGAGTTLQSVELVTLIQDAVFLYPQILDTGGYESIDIGDQAIYGFFLDENDPVNGNEYLFTNVKPYVIYGYAAVDTGKTLNIQPGARVHFHDGSGILVANGASIKAIGTLSTPETQDGEIIFEGDRLEPDFSDVPGQWGAIWMTSGSTGNEFKHCTIKNGVIGLYVQNSDVTLNETQIYDCSNFGVLAQTANITGTNVVINNAGQAALACTYGGSYDFTHSTFNNNWPSSSQVAVLINNYVEGALPEVQPLNAANFTNCIIFGSNQVELFLDKRNPTDVFEYNFTKCQIKFNNTNNQFTDDPLYAFINDESQIIKNGDPNFFNVNSNKLWIGDESDANDFGIDTVIDMDILGTQRVAGPGGFFDLGAYQHITFPED